MIAHEKLRVPPITRRPDNKSNTIGCRPESGRVMCHTTVRARSRIHCLARTRGDFLTEALGTYPSLRRRTLLSFALPRKGRPHSVSDRSQGSVWERHCIRRDDRRHPRLIFGPHRFSTSGRPNKCAEVVETRRRRLLQCARAFHTDHCN